MQSGRAAAPAAVVIIGSYAAPSGEGAEPEALCANNPVLSASSVTRFASECRAYIYISTSTYTECSAWFVDSTHVVTAGHCVAEPGSGQYRTFAIDGAYGIVCCSPGTSGQYRDCASDSRFFISAVVSTTGWVNSGNGENDGAVMKVNRYANTDGGFGVPVPTGSIAAAACGSRAVYWGGFPSQSTNSGGCNVNFAERYRYTNVQQAPNPCPDAYSGNALTFGGDSCPGMSGGRLLDRASGMAIGILVRSSISCSSSGTSIVEFTQLVNNAGTSGGIFVQGMISAIP
jgi:hypothetical protein